MCYRHMQLCFQCRRLAASRSVTPPARVGPLMHEGCYRNGRTGTPDLSCTRVASWPEEGRETTRANAPAIRGPRTARLPSFLQGSQSQATKVVGRYFAGVLGIPDLAARLDQPCNSPRQGQGGRIWQASWTEPHGQWTCHGWSPTVRSIALPEMGNHLQNGTIPPVSPVGRLMNRTIIFGVAVNLPKKARRTSLTDLGGM